MYSETRDKQINYYLKLSGAVLLVVAAVFLIVVSGAVSSYLSTVSPTKTISVSGYAEMNAEPDVRTLYINLEGKGTTEKLAQESASVKSKTVNDALKAEKISNADIKSQNLSTNPEYKNECAPSDDVVYEKTLTPYKPCVQNSVIIGYITTQSVEVTLRGDMMDKSAGIVATLTSKGVTVQTGEATVENPEKLKTDLRAKAISDARKNAEKMADALGVRLGKVESFDENSGGYYPMMAKMEARTMSSPADSATPPVISNGTQKVSSTVTVSFEIR